MERLFSEKIQNTDKVDYEKSDNFLRLRYKNMNRPCKIYQGDCIYKDNYIGETKRNGITRWSEHNNPTHDSELVQRLKTT